MRLTKNAEFIHAGLLHVTSDWTIKAHSHPFHELIVVERGCERVQIQDAVYTAEPGDILLFPTGVTHQEWAHGGKRLETVFLSFNWDMGDPAMPRHLHDRDGRVHELATWLFQEREGYFPGALDFRDSLLGALLVEYLRLQVQHDQPVVENVRTYVRAHLGEHFTLDDLAHAAGMSKYYFVRTYRTLTDLTPMEDARRIRLESARHLLLTTNMPLKAIAPRVGFANAYHLSRLLKNRLGIGARELRNTGG
jgi:AraC-like DNA-binding protein